MNVLQVSVLQAVMGNKTAPANSYVIAAILLYDYSISYIISIVYSYQVMEKKLILFEKRNLQDILQLAVYASFTWNVFHSI